MILDTEELGLNVQIPKFSLKKNFYASLIAWLKLRMGSVKMKGMKRFLKILAIKMIVQLTYFNSFPFSLQKIYFSFAKFLNTHRFQHIQPILFIRYEIFKLK